MNVLVTGANGQLGNEMQIVARDSADTYFFTDVCDGYEHLDITDLDAVRRYVGAHNIDCIVNCAAWTNVDAAEDPDKYAIVEALNATAPGNLAMAMREVDGLLIHISTDYVFGGDPYNTPCREDQKGTPTGVYGATKLKGEENITRIGCRSVIIRTAWLYSEFGKNFVRTMLNLTATKPELKVVFDQVGTPTYAYDLASAIFDIIENRKFTGNSGIYHFSNEGVCSWYDFAKAIQQIRLTSLIAAPHSGHTPGIPSTEPPLKGAGGACIIHPCHSSEFPSPVKRPAYSVLDKTKIKQTFSISIPYWTDSLCACLNNMK